MWQPSVLETYGDGTTSYVERISGPLRNKYPDAMHREELMTALTQVVGSIIWNNIRHIRTKYPTTPMTRTLPS